jgi:hypothetical protein
MLRQTIQGTAFSKKADLKGIEHECGREYLFSGLFRYTAHSQEDLSERDFDCHRYLSFVQP